MLKIDVKSDISGALAKLERIASEVKDKALVRALNKTADQVKVQASREIRDAGYNIKVSRIKRAMSVRKAKKSELRAMVKALGNPIGLIAYEARQTKAGVTIAVKNGRKLIPHAFIATKHDGNKAVLIRVSNRHEKVRTKAGKVIWSAVGKQELFGPSVPSAFISKVVTEAMLSAVYTRFPKVFAQELRFVNLK